MLGLLKANIARLLNPISPDVNDAGIDAISSTVLPGVVTNSVTLPKPALSGKRTEVISGVTKWAVLATMLLPALLSGCGGTGAKLNNAPNASAPSDKPLNIDVSDVGTLPRYSLDEVVEVIDRVASENPQVPVRNDQFGALLLAEIKKDSVNPSQGKALKEQDKTRPGKSYSLSSITNAEWSLLLRYPWNASRTRDCVNRALEVTQSKFPGWSMSQDKADAFRHGYWNVLLCKRIDAWWAEQFTNAHESTSWGIDRAMDLNNNGVGRRIFRENGFRSESDLIGYVYWFPSKKVTSEGEMNINYLVHIK
jgi:hypothetical protein